MNLRTITVVSPQFPCGAAWLANAFIELRMRPTQLWSFDTSGEWATQEDGTAVYVADHLPWRQTLASLYPGLRLRFDPGLQARFTHLFPWQLELSEAAVLVVRDPRDALYSQWRRLLHNREMDPTLSFVDFCRRPFLGGPISNADMLWLHLRCWLDLQAWQPGVHLIRFEDWKRDDVGTLTALMQALGIERDAAAIRTACEASRFERLRELEREVERENPCARQFNRRGLAGEWLLTWEAMHHDALGPHWPTLLQALGYLPSPRVGSARLSFDIDEVLTWRDLHDAQRRASWGGRIAQWDTAP